MRQHTSKVALAFACLVGISLGSCVEDDLVGNEDNGKDKGIAVTFNVADTQNATRTAFADAPVTRAAFAKQLAQQGLQYSDLTSQKLDVSGVAGAGDLCMIESTTPGMNGVKANAAQTRANISTAITQKFSSIGYRGTSAAGISTSAWFHNKETNADGTLVEDIRWSWEQPYGRFYGISPQIVAGNSKLTVSPDTYSGTPYINFEVEQDVKKQVDLMTACSGVVQYATRFVAPTTNLDFRHALTAIRFKVGSNLSWNKTINKVEIINAMSKGKYTLPTDENGTGAGWSELSTPKTFTLGGDGTVNVSTSEAVNHIIMGNAGDNYTFYMIPQNLTGVSVKIYFSDGSAPIHVNLSGSWKPGTTKTYALSQKSSTWEYHLTVSDPAIARYTEKSADGYTVQSYREDPATHTQQPVKWKVVGYDANNDGTFSMDEQPEWLTSLTKDQGDGGVSAENGNAGLRTDIKDYLAERNKSLRDATPLGNAGNPYDLSTKGGSVPRTTANSYVISAPGYYCIPLVYGNAITNGVTNSRAYQTTVSNEYYVLRNFKDHANQDITDPWITRTNGGANVPDGAKLVWADENGLVTNIKLSGSGTNAAVKFEVPADGITNGNAVIAVMQGNTVVWSWHLWFAPQYVLNTTEITNFQNQKFNVINESLGSKFTLWNGSTYTSPRSVKVKVEQLVGQASGKQTAVFTVTQKNGYTHEGYNTYYQFGRKDPFPGTDSIAEGNYAFDPTKGGRTLGYAIQHPENMIASAGNGDYRLIAMKSNWCDADSYYENLWDADKATIEYTEKTSIKTIYDPSPAGFKIPESTAFTGFTTTGESTTNTAEFNIDGDWDFGWNFNNKLSNPDATLYFVASGYRGGESGKFYYLGCRGNYWTASPYSLRFWNCSRESEPEPFIHPKQYMKRSFAFSIRSVAE